MVLGAQYGSGVGEFSGLLQHGKDISFFEGFVIVLDERSDYLSAGVEFLCGSRIANLQAVDPFSVDQQDSFEDPVLAYQVFGSGDGHLLG
ncbi:hypothetical protein NJB1907Z4_C30070 [Mycobacterium pseudoshottsii]|uniref:Uncharacterized protein n=1 Tax=Mycobacterium pseudoshottsii TaxID=265949 RepID=A0A9N7LTJ4_9MYCO|nr:hypothetical protein NJB1907Z4_C30070 [Mycobacterium pseudoshottsii]